MKAPRFFGPWESPSAAAGRACWKAKRGASKSGSRTGAAVVPMEELTGERPFPARLSGTMISDFQESCKADRQTSIHVPREGDDVLSVPGFAVCNPFQSTSPARGTTCYRLWRYILWSYFNPRPPRGGRPNLRKWQERQNEFQSTSPARGTTRAETGKTFNHIISIHVPREGDDFLCLTAWSGSIDFNPRPPRGGRPMCKNRDT